MATQISQGSEVTTPLLNVLKNTSACELAPVHLFISWQGVLTLVYKGFPPPLETLKGSLGTVHPSLPQENPGARWPKTTLGCLGKGKRLSDAQFQQLKMLCQQQERQLLAADRVKVTAASVVLYECRSLERYLLSTDVALSLPMDKSSISKAQVDYVAGVVGEWDAEGYWFHVSKDGNRDDHYRGDHIGVTVVHWLARSEQQRSDNAVLLGVLRLVKRKVDELLPGMYTWFEEASLHCTVRNIKD